MHYKWKKGWRRVFTNTTLNKNVCFFPSVFKTWSYDRYTQTNSRSWYQSAIKFTYYVCPSFIKPCTKFKSNASIGSWDHCDKICTGDRWTDKKFTIYHSLLERGHSDLFSYSNQRYKHFFLVYVIPRIFLFQKIIFSILKPFQINKKREGGISLHIFIA